MYFDDNIREKLKSYTDANGRTIDNYPALRKYAKPLKKAERPIIGREVEMNRVMASLMRPELCNVMLLAEAGSGKAFEDSTPIPVSDMRGYVPIGDMSVGDMVFDESGKPVNVLGVFHQGKKRAYRVTFADGSQLICNDEHLWNVRTRYQHYHDRDYTTMTLRQIMDYGVVRSLAGGEMKSFYIPLNGAVERDEVDLPVHPYVLGALIGDGCLSGERVLTISSPDDGVPKKVASLIGAVGVQRNPNNYDWQFLSGGDVKFIRQADLADKCDFDNVFYTKSIYRRIPEIYKIASISQRMALLQGLMDTDGSLDNSDRHHCMFSTNSKGLAYDVLELLRSLGIRASIFESEREDKVNVEYSVFIKLPDEEKRKLFTDASGKGNISMIDNRRYHRIYNDMAIVDVEDLGYDVDMTCIYVDSESHLFQAGKEHIVTHNTALVQGCMLKDKDRYYLEVEPSKIIASVDKDRMANELKRLFDETEKFCKVNNVELVLFIDEFHQIVQLSDAAVEALKPLLADSGTRGIRVIAATTYDEFRMYIKPNQPLVERLQRINLEPPSKDMVVRILRDMARRYGVDNQFYDDNIFGLIYDLTNRYVPASAQPRKSLLVFDAMVGWYRFSHRRMNKKLLADVIYESTNVNVAFKVDATKIKKELDAHVFAQENATNIIAHRLQVCVADLHDKTKPMSSFLFCGSTGTGKTEMTKQLARILFDDSRRLIRFDMTEYANPESLSLFRKELTARIWERPYSIILLDEIEKACAEVTRLLLQVLDDGRLMDENNREVPFVNAYIIITTNAGSEVFKNIAQYDADDAGSGKQMQKYMKLIRQSITSTTGDNKFPPELLGRLDAIVPFQPLSEATQMKIVHAKLQSLANQVKAVHGVELVITNNVVDYIVRDNLTTDSDAGGARAAISKLNDEVVATVASYLNSHPNINTPIIATVSGDMAWQDKSMLESKAHIVVGPYKQIR
jgi:ATP-dependent Clp protease ATP-binding subunit ClpA/intein/homing endonuclease